MTGNQFKKLGNKFSPEFGTLVDAGTISLVNASIALQLPIEEQNHFLFEAEHFSQKSFVRTVKNWLKMPPEKRAAIIQILRDISNAFDGWDSWSGSYDADEGEDYSKMVAAARKRVLCYVHKLPIPSPTDGETDYDFEAG